MNIPVSSALAIKKMIIVASMTICLSSNILQAEGPRKKPLSQKLMLENSHYMAAQKAKEFAIGRNVALKILCPTGSEKSIEAVGKAFQQLSGINVEYIAVTLDEIVTEVKMTSLAGESYFDIGVPSTYGIPDLAEAKAIINLDGFKKIYEPEGFEADYLQPIGNYYKNSLYGYQTDGDSYLFIFNGKLLNDPSEKKAHREKFGKELKIPGTWEELDRMIEFFYRPDQNIYGGLLFRIHDYIHWEFLMRFHAKGCFPLADDMTPQINNEAGVKALEELIAVSRFLDPGASRYNYAESCNYFARGRNLCAVGWGGTYKVVAGEASRIREDTITAVPPGGIINGKLVRIPIYNWGFNYVVSSFSKRSRSI